MKYFNQKLNIETTSAIFIIVLMAAFVLANFFVGFVWPLYLLAVILGSAVAFVYPRSGIYAIIVLTFIFELFFALQSVWINDAEYKIYPIDFLLMAVFASIVFQLIKGKFRFKFTWVDGLFLAFFILDVLYFIFSFFLADARFALAFSSFKYYGFYPLVIYYGIVALFRDREDQLRLFRFGLAGAVAILFFIFYGILSGGGLWTELTPMSTEGVRILAFAHAFYLCLAFISLLALMLVKNENKNWSYWLLVIWTIGIVGSMMRHLWIGLALAVGLMYFAAGRPEKKLMQKLASKALFVGAVVAITLAYFSFIFPQTAMARIARENVVVIWQRVDSFSNPSADSSFSWRQVVWDNAMDQLSQEPILGVGFGKVMTVYDEQFKDFVEVRNIHNSPLVILVQMGVLSLLVFLIIVVVHVGQAWRKVKKHGWIDLAVFPMLGFYLLVFLFQPYLETNYYAIYFWMILGLVRARKDHQKLAVVA